MSSLVVMKRRTEGLVYEDQTFEKADLRSMRAFGAKFVRCSFIECKLDLSDLRNCRLENCGFHRCSLQRADFGASFLEGVFFLDCDMEQASFAGCHLNDVGFSSCRMAYGETLFDRATVRKDVAFTDCNLHGSNLDFRQAPPGELRFTDCNLWGAKMAIGCALWQSQFDEKTCQRFVAMIARIYPIAETRDTLIAVAGDQYPVIDRAMREQK